MIVSPFAFHNVRCSGGAIDYVKFAVLLNIAPKLQKSFQI